MESKRLTPTIVGKIASKRFVVVVVGQPECYLKIRRKLPNGCKITTYQKKTRKTLFFTLKILFCYLFFICYFIYLTITVMQHKILSCILRQKIPIFRKKFFEHRKRSLHRSRS